MRLLLDTQVMLWWLLDDPRLGVETRDLRAATPCVVSVASIWEVAIQHRLGKLPVAPASFRDQSLAAGAVLLPVLDGHVIQTAQLPVVHHDHLDRQPEPPASEHRPLVLPGLPERPRSDPRPPAWF